ncbi:hypothetical protein [Nocardioides flavus (ex Wang et al. 2016)]|uniref:hypothetical protein n=1 Tax=Nocardioides flavus (ex Wang et al. 2016) TaxID=2058780 RepID=UPI00174AE79A|nr:hypothetical protein [Nocardioides flavus (ex Wang et al. 2016)]
MGVDQKRPLMGFAFVAVLCAVLMSVSVERGFGLDDLVQPGKPIAAPDEPRAAAPTVDVVAEESPVSIPAELSTQPLALIVAAAPPSAPAAEVTGDGRSASAGSEQSTQSSAGPSTGRPVGTDDPSKAARKADREAAKAARKADREAAKAARKADRQAAKAARTAERQAAKAARKAEREAAKAARTAEREAAKAARKAERGASHGHDNGHGNRNGKG